MIVHVDFSVEGLKGSKVYAVADIYNALNSLPLISPQGQTLSYYATGNVTYDNTIFEDVTIFIPYAAIHLSSGGSNTFFLNVRIIDDGGNELAKSDNVGFYYSM